MGHVAKWQQLCRPGVKLDIKKFSTSNSPTIISSLTLTLDWLVENWATLLRRGILLPVILSYSWKWKNFILIFFSLFSRTLFRYFSLAWSLTNQRARRWLTLVPTLPRNNRKILARIILSLAIYRKSRGFFRSFANGFLRRLSLLT